MSTKLGLVGLPNAGKSTLFNALTSGHAAAAPYPFTTTDPNVGVAKVEDSRLEALARLIKPNKVIPATLECVDIAGLVKGAHDGEGLGNQFLSHIFGVDALLHVVRCFKDEDVAHPMGGIDPVRDAEIVNTELLLKDLEWLQRRREKESKSAKGGDKKALDLVGRLDHWIEALNDGKPIRQLGLALKERPSDFGVDVLSDKPVVYVANMAEGASEASDRAVEALAQLAQEQACPLVSCAAKLEAELAELDPADRMEMMQEMGVKESALPRVVREGYAALGRITFFTTVSGILQAWTVSKGTSAASAAGIIHTDFEKKFIKAEVISAEILLALGGEAKARTDGKLRTEGREYRVQDGDVITYRIGP